MRFKFDCLEHYCKSLKRDKSQKASNQFVSIENLRNKHLNLETNFSEWFLALKGKMLSRGEYQIHLKNFVQQNKSYIKEFEEIYFFFSSFFKKRIMYVFDTEIFNRRDMINELSCTNVSDQTQLNPIVLQKCLAAIEKESRDWSQRLREQRNICKQVFLLLSDIYPDALKVKFHSALKDKYSKFITEYVLPVKSFGEYGREDPKKENIKHADDSRKTGYLKNLIAHPGDNVNNETLWQTSEYSPLFFQETYERTLPETANFSVSCINNKLNLGHFFNSRMQTTKKKHLIVLVHGYGGSSYDMAIYKNFFSKIIPHALFLSSKANEEMKAKKIDDMGKDLADEVLDTLNSYKNIAKVSFVGHSLGGVIIRAALPYLERARTLLFSFISLSSPHLGTKQGKSFLVNTGIFFLGKIKKETAIKELQMDDESDIKKSFLYKLAQNDKLYWFNNILLVSSPQDAYVPYTSARIQPVPTSSETGIKNIINQMSNSIWSKVNNDMVVRIDVDLRSSER